MDCRRRELGKVKILSPAKDAAKDVELAKLLKKNPFMEKEVIHDHFEKKIREYLDYEFEEYCTCDDYYQPVVEDFEIEYRVIEWSRKGTNILKNKLDIRDIDVLHKAERDYSSVRQAELANKGVTGDFSFNHLCSIHKQLFQDIYTWAGKTRTVDISKGTIFCLVQFIEAQFEDLYRKLKNENFLSDITDKKEMSCRLAYYLGELNIVPAAGVH